jgi:hypothetical protein
VKLLATKRFRVLSYKVALSRQREGESGSVPFKFYAHIEIIGGGYSYGIYFLRPDSSIPDNSYNPEYKRGTAYLPSDQFAWYIDLLRNEKPLYVYLNSDKPYWNHLYTGPEPIGEEET